MSEPQFDKVPLVYYRGRHRIVLGWAEVKGDVFTGQIEPELGGDEFVKSITRGEIKGVSFDRCFVDEITGFASSFDCITPESQEWTRPEGIKVSGRIPGLFGTPIQIPSKIMTVKLPTAEELRERIEHDLAYDADRANSEYIRHELRAREHLLMTMSTTQGGEIKTESCDSPGAQQILQDAEPYNHYEVLMDRKFGSPYSSSISGDERYSQLMRLSEPGIDPEKALEIHDQLYPKPEE